MELKSGLPFWLIKDGLMNNYPKLEKNIKTDVVIIGGGITGALVGYELNQNGISTCTVDSRTIGLGSTCASTALLQYEIDKPLHELIPQIGKQKAQQAYLLCEKSIASLKKIASKIGFKEFEENQSLYYAHHPNKLRFIEREFKARKENGHDVKIIEKDEINKKYGINSVAGILSKVGAQTNAYSFAHHLHQYNLKAGQQVFDRTEVVSFKHSKNHVVCVTSEGYKIQAKWIVFATGYEAVKYIKESIVNLQSTYAIITEQNKIYQNLCNDTLIWNTADPYLYMRNTPDGRVLLGGRDDPFYNPKKRDALLKTKTTLLKKDFSRLYNDLDFKCEFSWCGTFGSTKDGLPYIGAYKGMPNSLFALGFGGNGITFSQIAAEMLTQKIVSGKMKHDNLFAFER